MSSVPSLFILDVGHGSSAILRDTKGVIVIDCAPGVVLMQNLAQLGISEITAVIISHADTDHLAGIMGLLLNKKIKIGAVYLNPDSTKHTKIWHEFKIAMAVARENGNVILQPSLTTTNSGQISAGDVEVEVLAPHPEITLSGPGGRDLKNRILTSNSVSVVIGLKHKGHRVAILAGDIDDIGFDNLLPTSPSFLNADILVFPHHGGSPGNASPENFSVMLCNYIKPKLIIFSIDGDHYDNPKDEIVRGIRNSLPDSHIVCTQLASKCFSKDSADNSHLTGFPAKGLENNRCCGGTIVINLDGASSLYSPKDLHKNFVQRLLAASGTPRCMY